MKTLSAVIVITFTIAFMIAISGCTFATGVNVDWTIGKQPPPPAPTIVIPPRRKPQHTPLPTY